MMQDWWVYLPIAGVFLLGTCLGFLLGHALARRTGS